MIDWNLCKSNNQNKNEFKSQEASPPAHKLFTYIDNNFNSVKRSSTFAFSIPVLPV